MQKKIRGPIPSQLHQRRPKTNDNECLLLAASRHRGQSRKPTPVYCQNNGQALAYVYFEDKPGRRSAAKLLSPRMTRGRSPAISPSCRSY
jgi:hypothetical protein